MGIKEEYFIFEIEKTLVFVLTEHHLQFSQTKKYPYSDMALWQFKGDGFELNILRHGKDAMVLFASSDELVDILVQKGVKVVEREIEEVDLENEVILLTNGERLEVEKNSWEGSIYWLFTLKEEERTIWRLSGGSDLNVVKRPVHLRYRAMPDAKGNPPEAIKKHLQDEQETSCLYALLTIIGLIAICFLIGWLII